MHHTINTYVCFDDTTDTNAYLLMHQWRQKGSIRFPFYDAHDLNTQPDPSEEYHLKRIIRTRLKVAQLFLVLVGENLRVNRFNLWEMEEAIKMDLPILVANLNGIRKQDEKNCPPILLDRGIMHISFRPKILQFAVNDWPVFYKTLKPENKEDPFFYGPEAY